MLKSQKIYFDKDGFPKKVEVLNADNVVVIQMNFEKIKYSEKFDKDNFELSSLVTDISDNCEENSCNTKETGLLDDVVYPLYLPANTMLASKDTIETDSGNRVILTFSGSKPFMIIEEKSSPSKEMEVTSVFGEPMQLSSSVAALGTNSLEWTANNVEYYITSTYLTSEEMMTIAESLNTAQVVEITNNK